MYCRQSGIRPVMVGIIILYSMSLFRQGQETEIGVFQTYPNFDLETVAFITLHLHLQREIMTLSCGIWEPENVFTIWTIFR